MPPRPTCLLIGAHDAPRQILWIHGYTGSRSAFVPIATRMAHKLDAQILLPILPGHETLETDLLQYTYEMLYASVHTQVVDALRTAVPLACVGYSFGGYFAAKLAQEYSACALVLALTPLRLRFPLSLPGISRALSLRRWWKKYLNRQDIDDRRGTVFYHRCPGNSFAFLDQGNDELNTLLADLRMPILTLHGGDDPLVEPTCGSYMVTLHGNPSDESHVLPHTRHALFFRPEHHAEEILLTGFLRKHI